MKKGLLYIANALNGLFNSLMRSDIANTKKHSKINCVCYIIIVGVLVLGLIPGVSALTRTGHITLLAVFEEDGEFRGSPADVQLQIEDGAGRVFLETIPLSKVDTQISTRFAKEIACNFAEFDCDRYDFFYTIKSAAGIVGGPSAGAAIAALTVSMLNDYDIDETAAITGTINSGEVVGPVGSLKEKIDAAEDVGLTKVIVPSVPATNEKDNITGIVEYGESLGIEVVTAAMLVDIMEELTGIDFEDEDNEIDVPRQYSTTMKKVAQDLCERSDKLIEEAPIIEKGKEEGAINLEWVQMQKDALNLTLKGKKAFEDKNYYSAASYCFGANIKANTLVYELKDLDEEESAEAAAFIYDQIDAFEETTAGREKKTITDLQTYMIVQERILESREYLSRGENDSATLGYSIERLNSARTWSVFFGQNGRNYKLDDESLQQSCREILEEVEERFQYLNLFFPGLLTDLRNNLMAADAYYQQGENEMCIYIAKRTKAEADIMVSLLGVSEEAAQEILSQKMNAARKAINKQIDKGIFPIIAYSYYEYARSLMDDNEYAAVIYAEYALELSDIDIYFERSQPVDIDIAMRVLKAYAPTILFVWGVIIGFLLCYVIVHDRIKKGSQKAQKQKKKPKRIKAVKPKHKTRTRISLRG